MGFCFRKFPILACSLSLFISSGVSFAKPGDYLVSRLDVEKDKDLKCCCCGYNLLDIPERLNNNPPVFYIKYNEGDNIEDAITSARKFNTDKKPEGLRATLFKKIEDIIAKIRANPRVAYEGSDSVEDSGLTITREVSGAFRDFIENLNGLFCIDCISNSMYTLGINTFREFRSSNLSSESDDRKYAKECTICLEKIIPYIGARFCGKCRKCYFCEDCKSKWSTCPVCKSRRLESNCYLFNKMIHCCSDCDNSHFKVYLKFGGSCGSEMELQEKKNGRRLMIAFDLKAESDKFVITDYTFYNDNLRAIFWTDGEIDLHRRIIVTEL